MTIFLWILADLFVVTPVVLGIMAFRTPVCKDGLDGFPSLAELQEAAKKKGVE